MDKAANECSELLKDLKNKFTMARPCFSRFLKWLTLKEKDSSESKADKRNLKKLQKEIFFRKHLDELEGSKSEKKKLLELYTLQLEIEESLQALLDKTEKEYIYATLFYQYLLDPEPIKENSLALRKCKEIFPENIGSTLFPTKRSFQIIK